MILIITLSSITPPALLTHISPHAIEINSQIDVPHFLPRYYFRDTFKSTVE
jgi:hypothetical protein